MATRRKSEKKPTEEVKATPVEPLKKPDNIPQDVWDRTPPQFRKTLWQPGKSGNPGGRVGRDPQTIATLKAAVSVGADRLLAIIQNDKSQDRDVIRAMEIILDRLYGKAVQPIDAAVNSTDVRKVVHEFKPGGKLDDWAG